LGMGCDCGASNKVWQVKWLIKGVRAL